MPLDRSFFEEKWLPKTVLWWRISLVEIWALSARYPPKASSPGPFSAFGKRHEIDAENWAMLDRETGLIKPGSADLWNFQIGRFEEQWIFSSCTSPREMRNEVGKRGRNLTSGDH